MGEAKRRRQALGSLYGTPEGSNRPLIAYKGFDQPELDRMALTRIRSALAAGQSVVLIGTEAARPLALAAGIPWLHEIPDGEPIPESVAWDPVIAEAGGPLLPSHHSEWALCVMGAGSTQWMANALTAAA
jgi:hypothetical protein